MSFLRPTGQPFASRSEVFARGGMAATSQPLATEAAVQTLRLGGNAVDAAIAANAVLGLVEPTGCGLGGDLFALVWSPQDREVIGLNASGRSPLGLAADYFEQAGLDRIPHRGVLPISVPGCADGWWQLHQRFGQLRWEQLFEEAIRHARDGFPMSPIIAGHWAASLRALGDQPGFRDVFAPADGTPKGGMLFRNPPLAKTLTQLAQGGVDAFYRGKTAEAMCSWIQAHGGFLDTADLRAHHSTWDVPLATTYRGTCVWELPPNGQGLAALQILNMLEDFDIGGLGFDSAERLHAFIEAKKLVFADRARFYADPAFAHLPLDGLVSKEYARQRASQIDPEKAALTDAPGEPQSWGADTVYLATGDASGLLVSLIQSNYRGMGCGVAVPELGFGLQNRGELFHLGAPAHPNAYAPGKRPFHTIIPAMLTRDDEAIAAFGVMGGDTQPQAHAQVVMNAVDFGYNWQEAGDAARFVHEGSSTPTGDRMTDGGTVHLEPGFGPETLQSLERRGHKLVHGGGVFGGYQCVARDPETGVLIGASESRKDGAAAGF